jgi:LAO/AO transport system kinase
LAEAATNLAERVLAGDRRSVARLISRIENNDDGIATDLAVLHRAGGKARVIGITGPPGSGKSSLVNEIALEYRRRGLSVGILAVDPSSPFSGGAILGDRVRMTELAADRGVFMRSMASRGALGGLALAAQDAVTVLDAAGYERIVIETVGVGQAEVDIASAADTTVVVGMPGMGDDVQAIKAGVLEIADLFVINKADQGRPAILEQQLHLALSMPEPGGWMTPILHTVATEPRGIPELVEQLEAHGDWLVSSGHLDAVRRRRYAGQLADLVQRGVLRRLATARDGRFDSLVAAITARQTDPHSAAEVLLGETAAG